MPCLVAVLQTSIKRDAHLQLYILRVDNHLVTSACCTDGYLAAVLRLSLSWIEMQQRITIKKNLVIHVEKATADRKFRLSV